MTTKITEEERLDLLRSLQTAVEAVTQEMKSIKEELKATQTNLASTGQQLDRQSISWKESSDNYESHVIESVKIINKHIEEFREEADRLKSYSKGIDENLKERIQVFSQRFDNYERTLQLIETSIKSIRDLDLDRINEKLKELPTLETIRKELSASTSPLVSKNDFSSLDNRVSKIQGGVDSHFRNSLISLFFAVVTVVGTNIFAYYTFAAKFDSIRTASPLQNDPSALTIPRRSSTEKTP